MSQQESDFQNAKDAIAVLFQKGIRLLALDFDKTIVSVHTAGYWRGGSPKLADHVRPCFQMLMKAAIESKMQVCIVTYSMQPDLIQDVLKLVLPKSDISKIMIRANSKDWADQPSVANAMLGKQQHIAWCVTELYDQKHLIIQPHEILLMDDDEDNVQVATEFGHQAYKVPEEDLTIEEIKQFADRLQVVKVMPVR